MSSNKNTTAKSIFLSTVNILMCNKYKIFNHQICSNANLGKLLIKRGAWGPWGGNLGALVLGWGGPYNCVMLRLCYLNCMINNLAKKLIVGHSTI